MTEPTALDGAVAAAGSITALASKLGVSVQACHRWVQRGWVPPRQALKIELFYDIPAKEMVKPSLREMADLLSS